MILFRLRHISGSAAFLICAAFSAALWASSSRALAGDFQGATHMTPYDEESINYSNVEADNRLSRLQRALESGEAILEHQEETGYLKSLLRWLGVPADSQMLVFSKTSFQRERISPKTPRAIFFSDDVYVGWVPGSPMLELSVADPKLGGVFYTLDQNKSSRPKLLRNNQCLECHASAKSMGVPGHLVRSFATDREGVVDLSSGTSLVNHRTPLAERWGGWYVTGTHGKQAHRGNLVGADAFERHEREPNYQGNLTDLNQFFEASRYPRPTSDIVALMVLEHQTHMHNFITRLNYEASLALQQYGHVNYLKGIVESFLKYVLFVEEAALSDPIQGNPEFMRTFQAQGPKDRQGRSLREFDLQKRIFKYPCSYLIYSEAFDRLPDPIKAHVYKRLWEILSGSDTSPAYREIPTATKTAILEILMDTKEGLPDYWMELRTGSHEN